MPQGEIRGLRHVCSDAAPSSDRKFPYRASHRALTNIERGRTFIAPEGGCNLSVGVHVGLPGVRKRFGERVRNLQVKACFHPALKPGNQAFIGRVTAAVNPRQETIVWPRFGASRAE